MKWCKLTILAGASSLWDVSNVIYSIVLIVKAKNEFSTMRRHWALAVESSTVNIKFRGSHKIGARNSEHQVAAVATVAVAPGIEGFHGQPGGQLL